VHRVRLMYVIATAGHVDHGKSTLLRALTGMEPDRWAEEQRRGMTIDLGFVWTRLPTGESIAFVDVPGHERFVPTMLAGVGCVPAVLFVVAADEGWQAQSEEHLGALDALGVQHALLAVTRSDLADPGPALAQARTRIAESTLGRVEAVAVSAVTGAGLGDLRDALHRLAQSIPDPDVDSDVRLWIDRSFVIRGAGTVVTGTLDRGTLRVGDELEVSSSGLRVTVRGLQTLHEDSTHVGATARVAINLRRVKRSEVPRGSALLTPAVWVCSDQIDVRSTGSPGSAPAQQMLHIGTAAVPAHVRALGNDTIRLRLARPLPLRIGDRALLRDPGQHLVRTGLTVLDPRPPRLDRRGAAARRSADLEQVTGVPDADGEVERRGALRATDLRTLGIGSQPTRAVQVADWFVDQPVWSRWRTRLIAVVDEHAARHPLESGPSQAIAQRALAIPDRRLLSNLVAQTAGLSEQDGRVVRADRVVQLPPGVAEMRARLQRAPYAALEASELKDLGLTPQALAAAARLELLLDIGGGIFLLPGADHAAAQALKAIPQPFTVADARQALGSTRRVVVPLLEHLDANRLTKRIDPSHRVVA
jgi:selenocysteine-specific elongation factor